MVADVPVRPPDANLTLDRLNPRALRIKPPLLISVVLLCVLAVPGPALGKLLSSDHTPFAPSSVILGAAWTGPRYAPPTNQVGDILPTVWAHDGNQYTVIDDGESDEDYRQVWKQSLARITGTPPHIHIAHVGSRTMPLPHTFQEIRGNRSLWGGPLGPYYSSGLVEAQKVLYATQQNDWQWGINAPFAGLAGIAYSSDLGQTWQSPAHPFPAPLGNLSWVIRGMGGSYPDGWVYALATEREFDATSLIMGRSRPDVASMTDPSKWQWVSGLTGPGHTPQFSSQFSAATPIASWGSHITYPQMAYDAPLHQYLLTFTWSYTATPPGIWRDGSELEILSAPHPWGPFSFVAREPNFGPSNGYSAGFPVSWISRDGRSLWLKWAANFNGCAAHLNCSGAYGFNYRRMRLSVAAHH